MSLVDKARRLSPGRIPSLRGHSARRQSGGHWALVDRFHRLRVVRLPPVLIVEGVRGSGKSSFLSRCQDSYHRERAWFWREELDARVDLATVPPDAESFFVEAGRQLRRDSSLLRPATTPRFNLMRRALADERGARILQPPPTLGDTVFAGVDAVAVAAAHSYGLSLPRRMSRGLRAASSGWYRLPFSPAGRWFRGAMAQVEESGQPRADAIRRALGSAFAEDILAMSTRRARLKVGKVILFVDAYHLIEDRSGSRFLLEFAKHARDIAAPVFLVLACRSQTTFSRWLKDSGGHAGAHLATSDVVEIHSLYRLSSEEVQLELLAMGIPPAKHQALVEASGGLPLALVLFGQIFGDGAGSTPREWQQNVLDRVPSVAGEISDGWVRDFCASIAGAVLEGVGDVVRTHAYAAAITRSFDRDLIEAILGDAFSGAAYNDLIGGPLTHRSQSWAVLTEETFKVRSFVREHLVAGEVERQAVARWHQRAHEHMLSRAGRTSGDEAFAARVEALYHLFNIDSEAADEELRQQWLAAYATQHLDRCDQLISAASDAARFRPEGAAGVLLLAGQLHVGAGSLTVAEQLFAEAQELALPSDRELRQSITAAHAAALRRLHRHDDARRQLRTLYGLSADNVVLRLHVAWTTSLLAKTEGRLDEAMLEAGTAQRCIVQARSLSTAGHVAKTHGLAGIQLRNAHLVRHRADIAMRVGDYRQADELLDTARSEYEDAGFDGGLGYVLVSRARLRRLEGDHVVARDLAADAIVAFAEYSSRDPTQSLRAIRAAAHAALTAGDLVSAKQLGWQLIESPEEDYPPARAIGFYVLAEVARAEEALEEATRWLGALNDRELVPARIFERRYGTLCAADANRADREPRDTCAVIDTFLRDGRSDQHPTLRFWANYIGALATVGNARQSEYLDRCEHALVMFKPRDGNEVPEHAALERLLTAPEAISRANLNLV